MDNYGVAKQYLIDIQAIVTQAVENLDRLPEESAPVANPPIDVREMCRVDVREMCRIILLDYCGTQPTEQMVDTLYNGIRAFLEDHFLPKE